MRIDHGDAVSLEGIVRRVFACQRGEMGGYIDADHFESQPFDAALIALAPLWQKADFHEIEDFLFKWEYALRKENEDGLSAKSYIEELDNLVTTLLNR